jgi:hypothetical protein
MAKARIHAHASTVWGAHVIKSRRVEVVATGAIPHRSEIAIPSIYIALPCMATGRRAVNVETVIGTHAVSFLAFVVPSRIEPIVAKRVIVERNCFALSGHQVTR